MIYVYAITDRPEAPLPAQLGLRDEGLTKVVWRDVVAVVSPFSGAELSKTADELWRYEEVMEELMRDRAVLPVRFGTLLPSRQRVDEILRQAYRALVQDIARVRGHVEIGMRFLSALEDGAEGGRPAAAPESTPRGTGPGSAYLCARLARERELRNRRRAKLRPVRDVYELLASHANASRLDEEPDDRHGTSAAFLVPRDRMTCFRNIVSEVAKAHPELALLCTGPWPPYSFVNAGASMTSTLVDDCHAH